MNVKDLKARYQLKSDKEVIQAIKENLETINRNGLHANFTKGNWKVDDAGVKILDMVFTYLEEDEVEDASSNEEKAMTELRGQNQDLTKQLSAMQQKFMTAQQEVQNSQREFHELQEKFLAMQEGQNETNASMIRKANTRADQAEKELSRLKEHHASIQENSSRRVKELQEKVSELMDKLQQNNDVMEKSVKAEYELLQAKKSEDKLYEKIQEGETHAQELTQKLQQTQDDHQNALRSIDATKAEIQAWLTTIRNMEHQMDACLSLMGEKGVPTLENTEESATTEKKEPPTLAEKTTQIREKAVSPAPLPSPVPQDKERAMLMQNLREIQQKREDEEKPSIWKRVASFF